MADLPPTVYASYGRAEQFSFATPSTHRFLDFDDDDPQAPSRHSDSDSESEDRRKFAEVNAIYSSQVSNEGREFVAKTSSNIFVEADEDDPIVFEEEPIVVTYEQSAVDPKSHAFWVLEYEKERLAEESCREKREIRAAVKAKLTRMAHEQKIQEIRERRKREVEGTKKRFEEEIAQLQRELAGLGLRSSRSMPPEIMGSFGGNFAAVAVGARRSLDDEPVTDEERVGELNVRIAEKKTATQAILRLMQGELEAFLAHLRAEAREIVALQKKKKVRMTLQMPEIRAVADVTPERLNAVVAAIEAAYDTLR
jgi:hypothetical protein